MCPSEAPAPIKLKAQLRAAASNDDTLEACWVVDKPDAVSAWRFQ